MEDSENQQEKRLDSERIEVSTAEEDKDLFDDAFGKDEERETARKKMKEKLAENLLKKKKKPDEISQKASENQDNSVYGSNENDENDKELQRSGKKGAETIENADVAAEEKGEAPAKKKRGRPKKMGSETAVPKKKRKNHNNSKIKVVVGEQNHRKEIEIGDDDAESENVDGEESGEGEEIINEEEKSFAKDKIKETILKKAKKSVEKDLGLDEERDELEPEFGDEDIGEEDLEKGTKEIEEDIDKLNEMLDIDETLKPELKLLSDYDRRTAYIGRKKSVHQQYGSEGTLFVGKVAEDSMRDFNVCLDGLNPHVVFVCGARGSGKSYVLGVIAEELALKNKEVGVVVIDPIGVFWSMKYPNKDPKEILSLTKWGLRPRGLDTLKVFIPEGMKNKVPNSTYDATFSLKPSLLTTDDWCLTFGIDRFSPSGLLLEKALAKAKQGYKNTSGKYIKANKDYSLEELIICFETDAEINSRDRGYRADSIRALVSRFDAAKSWGIFSKKGTPLAEISRTKQLSIIDTSVLDENVGALVIGILARRLLSARKIATRQEASTNVKEDVDSLLELEVPPTWLFIDEAHTLIPSGNVRTPATQALVEYVKQGRRPGCSLVFATQQPSAIDTKVLSQLDIIITHKLVFDDDIKAVFKRIPAITPLRYKKSTFIKTLPVGTALTGDRREETSRAFVMEIRPRMSQHEGRDIETVRSVRKLDNKRVVEMAVEMAYSKLGEIPMEASKVDQVVQTLNAKYSADMKLSDVLDGLEKKGVIIDPKTKILKVPDIKYQEDEAEEEEFTEEDAEKAVDDIAAEEAEMEEKAGEELPEKMELGKEEIPAEKRREFARVPEIRAFKKLIPRMEAFKKLEDMRRKKTLGFFGDEEKLESLVVKYIPIYKVRYNYFDSKNVYSIGEAYINSYTGEFLHLKNKLVESRGLQDISDLTESEVSMLMLLSEPKKSFPELVKASGFDEAKSKRLLETLVLKGFAKNVTENNKSHFWLNKKLDLPLRPLHPMLPSLGKVPLEDGEKAEIEPERFSKDKIPELLTKLWKRIVVKDTHKVYLPVYEGVLRYKDGRGRVILIEALRGMELR